MLSMKRPLVVFDLETTGILPRKDRIVELAAIRVMPDGSETSKCWLLNPEIHIPEETSAIHGITDEIVKDCPTFKEKAAEIFDFFRDADLAGFNSDHFDIPCLEAEFERAGMSFAASSRKHVDVQKIYHKMFPRNLSAAVREYLGRDHKGAHGAEADTRATLEVLKAQLERHGEVLPKSVDEMDALLNPRDPMNADRNGMLRWRDGELTINFGKKKGERVKDLLLNEPNYLRWIVRGDFDAETRMIIKDLLEHGRLPPAP
ncbi:MAG: 3'-5' exonuclease [Kiritimatiellae bacterium]|nr:3'-5' exonuclease [Kiritimatiellia bacterium]